MKNLFIFLLALSSVSTYANCDLSKTEVRDMVKAYLKTRVTGDLKRAYWINSLKSDTYSVFSVQFKTQDPNLKKDQVTTHMISVSCMNGRPFIDLDTGWSIPLDSLHPIE